MSEPVQVGRVDEQRLGRSIKALRHRLGWRQSDLALKCGLSQSAVSRLERGQLAGATIDAVDRVVAGLGAELDVRIRWRGEELDRLLDAVHAAMVDRLIEILTPLGWQCAPEVTFMVAGERGSVDLMAWHEPSRRLLIVETKSVVPDMQQMLSAFDRKARLGSTIAARRGWPVSGVARAIVLAGTTANRRRVEAFSATLRSALPDDGRTMKLWLADPAGRCPAALWFLSDSRVLTTIRRRRVRLKRNVGSGGRVVGNSSAAGPAGPRRPEPKPAGEKLSHG
jgi:transcriptional regulator with XRE-family HTH domain